MCACTWDVAVAIIEFAGNRNSRYSQKIWDTVQKKSVKFEFKLQKAVK
jgi:hypothetical protein